MKVFLIVIVCIILALFLLFGYALMKTSSRCSRLEEKRIEEDNNEINK